MEKGWLEKQRFFPYYQGEVKLGSTCSARGITRSIVTSRYIIHHRQQL